MPPPEASHSIAIGAEKCSIAAEAQDKDFKIVIMIMFKDSKEDANKCLKEHENTKKLNEIMKTIKKEFKKKIELPTSPPQ